MSAGSNLRSEDQFLCSICLDVFTDPVSTPCGHNFCKTCITQHWDGGNLYKCPLCNELFYSRPQLRVNTFIREMVDQFRHEAEQETSSSSKQQAAKPGEVPCDVCSGTRLKALKSCLVCLLSYCENHLEPHLTASRLKRHQLVDPVENLEDRMCLKHDKPLELFCRTDLTCVCLLCSVLDHKTHEFVPLREECEGKKEELEKTEAVVQQMIHNRRLKIQEIKESLKISQDAADRHRAEGIQVFTALKKCVDRSLKELLKEIQHKQKTTEKQAEHFIKDLEQEISELMKRRSEVKQLSCSEGHLPLFQSFTSLKAAPPTKDWTEVRVHPPLYEETVVRAVSQLEDNLRKNIQTFRLKKVQQFTTQAAVVMSDNTIMNVASAAQISPFQAPIASPQPVINVCPNQTGRHRPGAMQKRFPNRQGWVQQSQPQLQSCWGCGQVGHIVRDCRNAHRNPDWFGRGRGPRAIRGRGGPVNLEAFHRGY